MFDFFSFCKDMYDTPIDVADYFTEIHTRDSKKFKNFELSLWQHIKNIIGYSFHELVLLFFLLVNGYERSESKRMARNLFPIMLSFITSHFITDLFAIIYRTKQ